MKIKLDSSKTANDFASRAFFLAWQACGGPLGMGVFQDRPQATEKEVFDNVMKAGDYCRGKPTAYKGEVRADYVFGRMMKLSIGTNDTEVISSREDKYDPEYQGFARKYPNIKALFEATAASLGVKYKEIS